MPSGEIAINCPLAKPPETVPVVSIGFAVRSIIPIVLLLLFKKNAVVSSGVTTTEIGPLIQFAVSSTEAVKAFVATSIIAIPAFILHTNTFEQS